MHNTKQINRKFWDKKFNEILDSSVDKSIRAFIGRITADAIHYLLESGRIREENLTENPDALEKILFDASKYDWQLLKRAILSNLCQQLNLSEGNIGELSLSDAISVLKNNFYFSSTKNRKVEAVNEANDEDSIYSTRQQPQFHQQLEEPIEEMRQKELTYRMLYDTSPDLYRTIDMNGIIVDCNKSYADALGYSKEELIGTSIFDIVPEWCHDAMRESFEKWKKTGRVSNQEVWLKRRNGTVFPALISATTIRDANGNIVRSNTVIRDITEIYKVKAELERTNEELRQKEKELERVNEELERKDKLKDEFISVASHELRTPIQPILGYAELAKDGVIQPDEAWKEVIENAYRLQRLANDILDVSRIESGSMRYLKEKISINEILLDVVATARVNVKDGVSIETELEEDVIVEADKDRITQVLTNIIGNAVKFTKRGTIRTVTRILPEKDGDKVEIRIIDNAGGIPEDILPSLFNKFATKRVRGGNQHGTGLGLYISKAIVSAHDGEITAFNNESGATFRIVLPIRKVSTDSKTIE